jgi:V8-like Glu-specific endopeptidase
VFTYSTNNASISCGSTIINDRFVIFAAHCQSQFQKSV